eukprot:1647784-Rhodomonas_salina.1
MKKTSSSNAKRDTQAQYAPGHGDVTVPVPHWQPTPARRLTEQCLLGHHPTSAKAIMQPQHGVRRGASRDNCDDVMVMMTQEQSS